MGRIKSQEHIYEPEPTTKAHVSLCKCADSQKPSLLTYSNTYTKAVCVDSDKNSGLEVIKLEYSLKLKIKRNDWLLADTCLQAANHCVLF